MGLDMYLSARRTFHPTSAAADHISHLPELMVTGPRSLRSPRRRRTLRSWWRDLWNERELFNGPGSEGE